MLLILICYNIVVTMHKDKYKHEKSQLFSFSNSIRNSKQGTPQSSNNVSFQNGLSAIKSYNTESFSLLSESAYPHLFQINNKENDNLKKFNSNTLNRDRSSDKIKMRKQKEKSNSKSNLSKLAESKEKRRPALVEKSVNILPSVQLDLTESVTTNKSNKTSINRMGSEKKFDYSSKREENIKVYVRLKPNTDESQREVVQMLNDKTVKIDQNYYCFDKIFDQEAKQQILFDSVGSNMCRQLFEGYNGTIFAYGQTGSGKTFTIFGQEDPQKYGLIYRCIREILSYSIRNKIQAKIKCSMAELYKEQIIDMFGVGTDLKLKQAKNGEVYIEGLKEVYIKNEKEMMSLVKQGAKGRKVTSTKLNQVSSRSHTILSIYLERPQYTTKLCLIDLAGSEKVTKSGTQGQAFQQTKKINYSLSCLGNVINALTTRNKAQHIPFRDSKLTRLLKDSLTGNFLTSIIVNCSISEQFMNETVSSLKFAQRAKKVKVNIQSLEEQLKQKQTVTHLHSIIQKLQSQLQVTTNELNMYKTKDMTNSQMKNSKPLRKKIFINVPVEKIQKLRELSIARQKNNEERSHSCQSQLTARNPIPSQRAYVQQNIRKYNEKIEVKPRPQQNNSMFLNEFSSLNVSKSIRKFDNSPEISSLDFKYDQSPDISLSFSIQGDSARRQVFLNTPI